jgi:hypothetical protein
MGKSKKPAATLSLTTLADGIGNITPAFCEVTGEAASICLENQGHSSGVSLGVSGKWKRNCVVEWTPSTFKTQATWKDLQHTTEFGAIGVAFLMVQELTDYTVIERSVKSTGIDYWLGFEDDMLFQRKARLEISGILNGDERTINARVKTRLSQTGQSDSTKLPAFVFIVEFGTPTAKTVKK